MNYGMFTDKGNTLVGELIALAKNTGMDWPMVYDIMKAIARDNEEYAELMDTAVREVVYDACGFESSFYL